MAKVAIFKSSESEIVVKFLDEQEFNERGRRLVRSLEFWAAYYLDGEIVIFEAGFIHHNVMR